MIWTPTSKADGTVWRDSQTGTSVQLFPVTLTDLITQQSITEYAWNMREISSTFRDVKYQFRLRFTKKTEQETIDRVLKFLLYPKYNVMSIDYRGPTPPTHPLQGKVAQVFPSGKLFKLGLVRVFSHSTAVNIYFKVSLADIDSLQLVKKLKTIRAKENVLLSKD